MTETVTAVELPELRVPPPGGEDFVVPDPGMYELVIAEILETRQSSFKGVIRPGKIDVRLKLQVVGGAFDGVWFKQWFGYSLHEKAKLRPVLLAIRNNRPIDPTKPVELTKYLNKPFRALVDVDETPARDDPNRIMKFAKVISAKAIGDDSPPAPPAASAAEPAAAAADDEADSDDDPFDV